MAENERKAKKGVPETSGGPGQTGKVAAYVHWWSDGSGCPSDLREEAGVWRLAHRKWEPAVRLGMLL
ncbi:hypothetical protein HPP92_003429 [Vanilla planifolia]|uniref:Uncharacterized protein n=1 Tax=Vanilla planifolia TaxID=51239 RepID=A0A835SGG1_VANPL|nr:hypothetical protein HPP92_003429 [Vanilla planifolia]